MKNTKSFQLHITNLLATISYRYSDNDCSEHAMSTEPLVCVDDMNPSNDKSTVSC